MRWVLSIFCLVFWGTSPVHAQEAEAEDYRTLVQLHDELLEFMVPGFYAEVVLESGARVDGTYVESLMAEKL